MESKHLELFIISDSVGETARKVIEAVLSQFPDLETTIHHHPLIRTQEDLEKFFKKQKRLTVLLSILWL